MKTRNEGYDRALARYLIGFIEFIRVTIGSSPKEHASTARWNLYTLNFVVLLNDATCSLDGRIESETLLYECVNFLR